MKRKITRKRKHRWKFVSPATQLTPGAVIRQTDDSSTKQGRQTETNHSSECSRKLNGQAVTIAAISSVSKPAATHCFKVGATAAKKKSLKRKGCSSPSPSTLSPF
ncbi:hypothetical protein CDAR_259841 [Caerostris darwini]|uniref:Ribosomal protein L32 n=1 Tax=Caerostris darwini TaxID=1538125 RepID=A0AAV4MWB2_9ARAC|nr:hypothetical protein CDAR_259841 [Caerostris darwini]